MSARFVTAKVLGSLATLAFVVAFNFFLFRVVEGDPVANLFRGRNLSQSQRAELTKQFGLDRLHRRAVRALRRADRAAEPRAHVHRQPAGRVGDLAQGGADHRARRHLDAALDGLRRDARHRRGLAKTDEDRLLGDDASPWRPTPCPTSGSGMLLLTAFAVGAGLVPGRRHRRPQLRRDRPGEARRPGQAHVPARADADPRLPRRVRARHALVAAGDDARGLPRARAGQGPARHRSCATATRCPTRCCRWSR